MAGLLFMFGNGWATILTDNGWAAILTGNDFVKLSKIL
jgi:hypothetical protein